MGLAHVGGDGAAHRRARGILRSSRTVVTRFVADPALGGSWGPYYRDWPFALVPGTDPLYAVVPELADVADHVVTAGTFGKWPVLRELWAPTRT